MSTNFRKDKWMYVQTNRWTDKHNSENYIPLCTQISRRYENKHKEMTTCSFLLHLAIGSGGNSISSNDLFKTLLDKDAVKKTK